MDTGSADSSTSQPNEATNADPPSSTVDQDNSAWNAPSVLSPSALASWTKNIKLPESLVSLQPDSQTANATKTALSRIAGGFSLPFPSKPYSTQESAVGNPATSQSGVFESITKGLVDSSMSAVKAVQVKARHIVSQNKRRYQEGGFDLDMTYITENIIAMGFPAGDMSSGLFGYFEGLYRNHMEEVIKFFETHHKGKYKVYNLCSERLYDASLFEGKFCGKRLECGYITFPQARKIYLFDRTPKVASFPFDDHNCPPLQLIKLFCQSAYSWLKEDIINVVVVHCKAGMARTGLMICSLLLHLNFFPTAEECIDYYNQKRCVDGKGLILPSQIRYVKYFERIITEFNGEIPPGRRCILRGFRLHRCPYWIRPSITISNHNGVLFTTKKHPKTKDLRPEDFWIRAARKGIVVFALPGEPGLTDLVGDFKIQFHDGQGDFYCWLNTTMVENRVILDAYDFDGFDKRRLPSPGFKVEIVMIDYDGTSPSKFKIGDTPNKTDGVSGKSSSSQDAVKTNMVSKSRSNDDDVFSDNEGEETSSSRSAMADKPNLTGNAGSSNTTEQISTLTHQAGQLSMRSNESGNLQTDTRNEMNINGVERTATIPNLGSGDIKAIAADASVFSFGDDEDYESE